MITEVRERKRLGKVAAGFDDGVEGNQPRKASASRRPKRQVK